MEHPSRVAGANTGAELQVLTGGVARGSALTKSLKVTQRFIRRKPLGAAGAAILLVIVAVTVFSDVIAPYDWATVSPKHAFESPSFTHLFGTDNLGEDVFSRIVIGAKPSVYSGLFVVVASAVLGLLTGVASAYYGGVVDLLVQRVVDAMLAFPGLILAMALLAVFSSGIHVGPVVIPVVWHSIPIMTVLTLTFVFTPITARVVRSATLAVMFSPYIDAARSIGAESERIILRHLVPNVLAPTIVVTTAQLGNVILIEASLSFLGLGLPPPHPSWGGMLQGNGRQYMEIAPWLAIFPGLAISSTVLAVNLLGDAIRDVADPQLRGAG